MNNAVTVARIGKKMSNMKKELEFRDEFEKITVSASNQRSIDVGVIQTNGPSFLHFWIGGSD